MNAPALINKVGIGSLIAMAKEDAPAFTPVSSSFVTGSIWPPDVPAVIKLEGEPWVSSKGRAKINQSFFSAYMAVTGDFVNNGTLHSFDTATGTWQPLQHELAINRASQAIQELALKKGETSVLAARDGHVLKGIVEQLKGKVFEQDP